MVTDTVWSPLSVVVSVSTRIPLASRSAIQPNNAAGRADAIAICNPLPG